MQPSSPLEQPQPPHPLARALCDALRDRPGARVVDFATGRGRNAAALLAAGFEVLAIADEAAAAAEPFEGAAVPYAAVLSTHGFLHGTPDAIARRIAAAARALEGGGRLYATFGSVRDARFGLGTELAPNCYAPDDGDERGVAHTFYDREELSSVLERWFSVERLDERAVDAIAGKWAHEEHPLERSVHWFAIARVRPAD